MKYKFWHAFCNSADKLKDKDMSEKLEKEILDEKDTQIHTEEDCQESAAATPNGQAEEEKAEPTVEEQLEQAKAEISELNDKLLRKIAEFDNYRKRTLKEKTELILNGGEKIITSILPVLDDMERAILNMKNTDDVAALLEGMELIFKKFLDILEKQGVKPIDTKDANFDVDLHEAIAQLPAPCDEMKGKVMDCTKTGYTLNEKVIRHSQVVVGL
ncbi:MAG: nucleotide exchange factor GrpE [Bacteroidaceae bacterium]|nr:nucleotide exchange factor GrpE [Bacteroidaceae bacterium]